MRVSTIAMLLGAAVCAAAAALLTKSWLATRPEQPVAVIQPVTAPATKTVVVAAVPLKFGTALSADHLTEIAWPADSVPSDAFSSRQALLAGGPRIVLSAIAKSEPVLRSKISGPGQRASLSTMIEDGKKAVTIRVDDVLGVAGFVQPDDRVDVLLTRNERGLAPGSPPSGSAYTDLLLQNVRVLAIDQIADRNTQAKPVKAVTLEVDTADAQKLVLAASVGQLSLALRRAGGTETSATRRIGLEDLPLSRPSETPQVTFAAEPDRGPSVTVIRGAGERQQYDLSPNASRAPASPLGESSQLKGAQAQAQQAVGEGGENAPQQR